MAIAATVTDKKAIMRDKRAQGIAAMGLVNREGDRFRVTTPTLRGRRASYEVWRDAEGKVRCSCLEFEEQSAEDASYRCEHILAVKHSLKLKNSEANAKQPPVAAEEGATENRTADTPNTKETNASEKTASVETASVATAKTVAARKVTPRFAREQAESIEDEKNAEQNVSEVSAAAIGQLAEHINEEEQKEVSMKKQTSAFVEEPMNETAFDSEVPEQATTAGAPVVSLAFVNMLRQLRQPIDPSLIKTREGWTDRQGNKHFVEYVEWHTVADILDRVVPTWSHSVRNIVQIGDMVAVTAAITIDGVTREGVGTGTADNETGIKKAEHDALKRAAIKFGIARELYQRESEVIEREGSARTEGEFPRDPLAKSMADLVTPKQLGMIRALAREAGVDAEEECQSVLRCRTEELSKRAASSFIDHLKRTQQEAASNGMRRAS